MNRRRFLLITAAVAAFPGAARAGLTRWQADMLGGTVRVDLRGPRDLAQDVATRIGAAIAEVEAAASLFNSDSALSRLNAAGRLDDPPPVLLDLMRLSGKMHAMTDGRFDPTIQPLWRALAEGRDPAPAHAAIGLARVQVGPPIRLDKGQALTFNGIAQGYAADRVRGLLQEAGYRDALVDMGEFAALGGPFHISIEDPALGGIATRRLSGNAVATSSPTAMRIGGDFHILGPRGETPGWSTVSVEAENAALADGFSTAFCLMPCEAIRAALHRSPAVTRVTAVDFAGDVSTF
ncbi:MULTISPECIES: FAD:protein FMN transferase [unclassified Shinella]|jgi:FAD:protein FMN transferase|uniref:FAD:protein FMN transferase n=1 Tax=unclassified Shinella TaxID=2643062 RepID=UPI00234EA817|nr:MULTISPECIES: FAD:protein FMN transferase [unclassified Shinella]MCO5151905.1 FAD:protein FMN transferase [Shinella sp.]MDC7265507.1 FAD:protein FMN transferase [Shinella sp. HY16]MDC7272404.1 FAD:protein FMN transferase [Shinella sp. YZ44]